MKNKSNIIAAVLVVVILVGISTFAYISNNSDELESQNLKTVENAGTYAFYNEAFLAKDGSQKTLLFFSADWCPTCQALERDINRNLDKIPEDMVILEIDYDNAFELKEKYDVVRQHTIFQVDEKGKVLKDLSGTFRLEDLVEGVV